MAKDKVIKVTNPLVPIPDEELLQLADKIVQVIEDGKQSLAISINEIVKTTYWKICESKIWHVNVVESRQSVESKGWKRLQSS